jgi:hypothetical protein
VRVRVESHGVVGAAAHLRSEADGARRLAGTAVALGSEVTDPSLGEALALLGDVCGDVLEVAALDLELLATTVRAGAALYAAVERGVVRAARSAAP